jgi:hypothetical protein
MTRTPRALLVFSLLLALIGAGAFLFLRGGPGRLPQASRAHEAPAAQDVPAPVESAPSREAVAPAPPPAPATEAPPSYVAALGAFTGRLLEKDLTPVAGLKVSAVEFDLERYLLEPSVLLEESHAPPPIESAHAVSGEDGRFTLAGLEPRAIHMLGVDLAGPRATFRVIDTNPITGEVVDLGDIVLEPFVTFVGRVVNEEREPVAGARVRATNLPALIFQFGVADVRRGCGVMADVLGSPKAFDLPPVVWEFEKLLPIPTTQSDAEGKFELKGVPLGMVSIVADKVGWRAAVKTTPSGQAPIRKVGDVMLSEGAALGGTVVDGAGVPVAGVEVLAGIRIGAAPVPVALLQPAGRTNERGEFKLGGLPAGDDAYVATRASRGQPWRVHGPLAAAESGLKIELSPPSGFLVRLHDAAGAPVADAELFIAPDPLEGGVPLPPIFAPPMQKLTEVSDAGDGTKRVVGLDAGKYQLIGRAAGFALATANVVAGDPPPTCELVFQPANQVEVTVVRAKDRHPLEWAFASLAPKGMFERPVARARSDSEGHLELARVPAGQYVLSVHHPAQATLDLDVTVPTPPLTVELVVGGNLKGRLLDRGKPPGRSLFVILLPRGAEQPDQMLPTFTASADTGDFVAMNLAVGDYRFEVRDRLVGKGPLALFQTMRDDPLARGEFTIKEGETTEVAVDVAGGDGPMAELYGTVWMNGVLAPDVSVRVEGPRNRTVKSDADGNYRFDALPAGKSKVLVEGLKDGDFFSLASVVHREEVELSGGESRRLDLILEVVALRGRVTGPGPLPAGLGTFVILRDAAAGANQMTTPNPLTGSYEFLHVPAAKYDLMVRRPGAAPFTATFEIDPKRGDVEYDVALEPSIAVRGRVVLPEGVAPLGKDARGLLMLIDAEGRPAGRGQVDGRTLDYSIDDANPGDYRVQLFRGDGSGDTYVARAVTIPSGGSSNLTLTFEVPAQDEKLVKPTFGPERPGRTRRARGN